MSSRINLRETIYLLGHYSNEITGSKLPSNKQVSRVLFFNLRQVKLNLRESARLSIRETLVFWEKARVPTKKEQHGVEKLEALYEEWSSLQKHANRRSEIQEQKVADFVERLDDLFDIAHANALHSRRKKGIVVK